MEGGIELCNFCGTCSAVCPMWDFYPDFISNNTPRAIIRRIRLGEPLNTIQGFALCLECSACESACPQGVRFKKVLSLIPLKRTYCQKCGAEIRGDVLIKHLEDLTNRRITLCAKCERRDVADKLRQFLPNPIILQRGQK